MVDTNKAIEGKYLNAEVVRNSASRKCVVLTEGEYVSKEYNGEKYEKFQFEVELDGNVKIWSPNKDTIKNLREEFGNDSIKWIGQMIKLSVGKVQGKDTVNGIPIPIPKIVTESV